MGPLGFAAAPRQVAALTGTGSPAPVIATDGPAPFLPHGLPQDASHGRLRGGNRSTLPSAFRSLFPAPGLRQEGSRTWTRNCQFPGIHSSATTKAGHRHTGRVFMDAHFTAIVTGTLGPENGVDIVSTQFEDGVRFAGTRRFTWRTPATWPGALPAKVTSAEDSPIPAEMGRE